MPRCDAPEYFGICDPFVPGVLIYKHDNESITVRDTWIHGPAEEAGICPGDKILAVNGVMALENSMTRMLREIVADSAEPVTLRVRRGDQDLEFSLPRVRESTLASLSRRKFLQRETVPLNQSLGGLERLKTFRNRSLARQGLKLVERFLFPLETPQNQAEEFLHRLREASNAERNAGRIGSARRGDGYALGFEVMLLKNPQEAWIYRVMPNSPAHRARMFPGDQLLELDGRSVSHLTQKELEGLLAQEEQPREIGIKVGRGDSTLSFHLMSERAGESMQGSSDEVIPPWRDKLSSADYIVGIWALRDSSAREVIVENVEYPSPAFDAGLLVGDLLLRVNRQPTQPLDSADLKTLLAPSQGEKLTLEVEREGKELTFEITPVKYEELLGRIGRKLTALGPAPQHCPEPASAP